MQHYKTPDNIKYAELLQDIKDMNEINNNLNKLLFDQNQQLNNIEIIGVDTLGTINDSNKELVIASKHTFKFKPIIIGGLIGASILGPTCLLLGANGLSMYIIGGGALIGSVIGKNLS